MLPVPAELWWETETPPRGAVLDCSQSLPPGNMLLRYPRQPGTYPIAPSPPLKQKEMKRQVYKDGLKSLAQVIATGFSLPRTPGEQALGGASQLESLGGALGMLEKDIGSVLLEP